MTHDARTEPPAIEDFLSRLPLFADHTAAELAGIAALVTEANVPGGCVLMREGDGGREAYVIVDGQASLVLAGKHLATLGPGSVLGGESILDGVRTATVVAETPMRLFVLDRRSFLTALFRTSDAPDGPATLDERGGMPR